MRVIQAQSAGFCYGVERAVRMAEEALCSEALIEAAIAGTEVVEVG